MVEGVEVQKRESELVCAYCREPIEDGIVENSYTCLGCKAVYHWPCLQELGRCGTLGCDGGEAAQRVVDKARSAFIIGGAVVLVVLLGGIALAGGIEWRALYWPVVASVFYFGRAAIRAVRA